MSETLTLGGRSWDLPQQLMWRVVKKVQPALAEFQSVGWDNLTEPNLDRLASVVFCALSSVDSSLSRNAFDDLPITVSDMIQAVPVVARACGLKAAPSGAEGSPPGE